MVKPLEIGTVVESTAGRDQGKFFLICAQDGDDFCLIVDGRLHKQSKPKRKRLKHVKSTDRVMTTIRDKWLAGAKVFDSEISASLKEYNVKKGEQNAQK